MSIIQDQQTIIAEYQKKIADIKEILDRFKMFDNSTEHDKDCALGDIREVVG